MIQTKGQSEAHPSLSPTDEFADYELWDRGNLNLVPKQPGMIQHEYLREALKNGLKLEQQLGANPFKFGMAAGSDAHTGLTAMEEDNYFCKFVELRAKAGAVGRERDEVRRARGEGLGSDRRWLHRRVGGGEHA